jgi:hypothetical protein
MALKCASISQPPHHLLQRWSAGGVCVYPLPLRGVIIVQAEDFQLAAGAPQAQMLRIAQVQFLPGHAVAGRRLGTPDPAQQPAHQPPRREPLQQRGWPYEVLAHPPLVVPALGPHLFDAPNGAPVRVLNRLPHQ